MNLSLRTKIIFLWAASWICFFPIHPSLLQALIDSSSFAGSRYDKQDWRRLRHTRLQGFQQTGFSLRIFFSFFLLQDFCFVIKEKTREMDTETHFKVFSLQFFLLVYPFFKYKTKTLKDHWNVEMNGLVGHIPGVQQGRRRMYSSRWDEVCAQTFARKGDQLSMQILFVGLGGLGGGGQYPGVLQPIF